MTTKPASEEYIPASCGGERCSMCGKPAERKVCENIFDDDPQPIRHELTAYVCLDHFNQIMDRSGYTRTSPQAESVGDECPDCGAEMIEVCSGLERRANPTFGCNATAPPKSAKDEESPQWHCDMIEALAKANGHKETGQLIISVNAIRAALTAKPDAPTEPYDRDTPFWEEQIRLGEQRKPDAGVDVASMDAIREQIDRFLENKLGRPLNTYELPVLWEAIKYLSSSGRLSSKAEWQDISTAPKDGQMIWAWDGEEGYLPLTWMPQFYGDKSDGYWACVYSDPFKPVENFTPKFFANLPKGALPQPPIAGGE